MHFMSFLFSKGGRGASHGANECCFILGLYDSYSLIYKEGKWWKAVLLHD